jgi:hypothetical protein
MVLTASHNPQVWNGLKCLVSGACAPAQVGRQRPPTLRLADSRSSPGSGHSEPVHGRRSVGSGTGSITRELAHRSVRRTSPSSSMRWIEAVTGRAAGSRGAGTFAPSSTAVNGFGHRGARGRWLERSGLARSIEQLHGRHPPVIFPHTAGADRARTSAPWARPSMTSRCGGAGFAQDPDADRLALIDERRARTSARSTRSRLGPDRGPRMLDGRPAPAEPRRLRRTCPPAA